MTEVKIPPFCNIQFFKLRVSIDAGVDFCCILTDLQERQDKLMKKMAKWRMIRILQSKEFIVKTSDLLRSPVEENEGKNDFFNFSTDNQ